MQGTQDTSRSAEEGRHDAAEAVRDQELWLCCAEGTQPRCWPWGYVQQGEQAPACASPGGTAGRATRVRARQGRALPLRAKDTCSSSPGQWAQGAEHRAGDAGQQDSRDTAHSDRQGQQLLRELMRFPSPGAMRVELVWRRGAGGRGQLLCTPMGSGAPRVMSTVLSVQGVTECTGLGTRGAERAQDARGA